MRSAGTEAAPGGPTARGILSAPHPLEKARDTLIDRGQGLEFPRDWANKGVPPEQILETLRPLLGLPVELVLPTHGAPTARAALERALS